MKLKFFLPVVSTVVILFTGCFIDFDDDQDIFGCLRHEGNVITKEYRLSAFDGVELLIPADVTITQGPTQRVTVEGYENILNRLETDVRRGVWKIKTERCIRDLGELKIWITIPDVKSLVISGSGTIYSENTLSSDEFDLTLSGSGEVDVALEVDKLQSVISGSGKLTLEGQADLSVLNISGSGDFYGFNLDTNRTDVNVSGSGNAEVWVKNFLKARISGSGDIFYRGQPEKDVAISGSGRVIDSN